MENYDIGGIHVLMTAKQAERWNSGRTTASDLQRARVIILESNGYREISLRRACSLQLEPQTAVVLARRFSAKPI